MDQVFMDADHRRSSWLGRSNLVQRTTLQSHVDKQYPLQSHVAYGHLRAISRSARNIERLLTLCSCLVSKHVVMHQVRLAASLCAGLHLDQNPFHKPGLETVQGRLRFASVCFFFLGFALTINRCNVTPCDPM